MTECWYTYTIRLSQATTDPHIDMASGLFTPLIAPLFLGALARQCFDLPGRTVSPPPVKAADSLDTELQAAHKRLRLIKAQREAVREQVLKYQVDLVGQPADGAAADHSVHQQRPSQQQVQLGPQLPNSRRSSCSQLPQLSNSRLHLPPESLQLEQQQPMEAAAIDTLTYLCAQPDGQQHHQGYQIVVCSSNSCCRSGFGAAALQRRAVSQSQLNLGCSGNPSASALAAAATAGGRSGNGSLFGSWPWASQAQRESGSSRLEPRDSAAVESTSGTTYTSLPAMQLIGPVGVGAAAVAALEKLLVSDCRAVVGNLSNNNSSLHLPSVTLSEAAVCTNKCGGGSNLMLEHSTSKVYEPAQGCHEAAVAAGGGASPRQRVYAATSSAPVSASNSTRNSQCQVVLEPAGSVQAALRNTAAGQVLQSLAAGSVDDCSSNAVKTPRAAASRQQSMGPLSGACSRRQSRRSVLDYGEPAIERSAAVVTDGASASAVFQSRGASPGRASADVRPPMPGSPPAPDSMLDATAAFGGFGSCTSHNSYSFNGGQAGSASDIYSAICNSSNHSSSCVSSGCGGTLSSSTCVSSSDGCYGNSGDGSSSSGTVHAELMRARQEARKAEELIKRAAELEQARR